LEEEEFMAKKGFVGSLFDFSFSNFITTTIIKIIYGLALLGVILGFLGYGIMGLILLFNDAAVQGLVMMVIVAPMFLVFGIIGARVYCELLVLMFRIAETLVSIENNTRGGGA